MKNSPLNKILACVAFTAAGLAPILVQAQTATPAAAPAPAAEPASPLSFNIGLTTDYRARGLAQSNFEPAISAGIDYAHSSGFYIGAWASSIKWIKDDGKTFAVDSGNTSVEIDVYGGYKAEITKDFTYDVGIFNYVYPGNNYANIPGGANATTTEIYGALTYSVATLKLSNTVTNLLGFADTKNSTYLDLSATFDLGSGFTLVPHVGYQKVHNFSAASYTDYSLSASKDFGSGFSATLAAVGTNADKTVYVTSEGKFKGRNALILSGKYTF